MTESLVDLAYRGLPLARRVKLTAVRPREAYVEMPAPMPVGTALRIATDEGLEIEARVIGVTEQTGGANGAPGMQIAPTLEGAAAEWWRARVALPDAPAAPRRLVIQPSASIPAPAPVAPVVVAAAPLMPAPPVLPSKAVTGTLFSASAPAEAAASAMDGATIPMPIIDDDDEPSEVGKRTTVMDAVVTDELLAQTTEASPSPPVIVDDGRETQVMEAVDLSALGLDASASGSMRASTQNDDDDSKPTAAGKKRRKRR